MAVWDAGCFGLANVVDGMSRERAARQAGMDRRTLRDWVIRFNAEGIIRSLCALDWAAPVSS